MLDKLYIYRFEFFLASQLAILFGSLVVPLDVFDFLSPLFFYVNIIAGSVFIRSQEKVRVWIIVLVLIIIGGVFAFSALNKTYSILFNHLKTGILFLFYIIVTFELIKQIWKAKLVDKKIIFGVISGFISLGFIGFFICISIEIVNSGSFAGLYVMNDASNILTERLMYFSYITLLTIGYGDIIPLTHIAQKATILIGLMGQIYLVIITAIIVGKYINQVSIKN